GSPPDGPALPAPLRHRDQLPAVGPGPGGNDQQGRAGAAAAGGAGLAAAAVLGVGARRSAGRAAAAPTRAATATAPAGLPDLVDCAYVDDPLGLPARSRNAQPYPELLGAMRLTTLELLGKLAPTAAVVTFFS